MIGIHYLKLQFIILQVNVFFNIIEFILVTTMKVNKKLNTNTLSQTQFIAHFQLLSPENKKYNLVELVQQLYQDKRQMCSLISLMQEILHKIQNPKHNSAMIENFLSEDTKITKKIMINTKIRKLFELSSMIMKQKLQVKPQKKGCCQIEKQIPEFCKLLTNMKDKKEILKYEKCKFLHSQELYVKISEIMDIINFKNGQEMEVPILLQKKYSERTKQTKHDLTVFSEQRKFPYLKRNVQKVNKHVQTETLESEEDKIIKMFNMQVKQYQKTTTSNYIRQQKKMSEDLNKIIEQIQKNKEKKILKDINNIFSELPSSVDETVHDKLTYISETFTSMVNKYKKTIDSLRSEKQKLILSSKEEIQNFSNSLYFCQSDILPFIKQQEHTHNFIISSLRKFQKMQPKKFKLLYKYKPQDITSRQQFDNRQKLLFIVELENGIILGGYSQLGFVQGVKSDNFGFLFSITQKQQYNLAQRFQTKPICSYDDYFIIFGNSDIRIKIGQNLMYSNFGCEMSYVRGSKGIGKINDFIGCESKRQTSIKTYEFYQVIF